MIDYIYLILILILIGFIVFLIYLSYEYRVKEGFSTNLNESHQVIRENFYDAENMYAMTINNQNFIYYSIIPHNVTSSTPLTWTQNGGNCVSISLSNKKALCVASRDGNMANLGIFYNSTPMSGTTWILLGQSNPLPNINFNKISFDGNKMEAMATNSANNIYYATIPNNINSSTQLAWTQNGGNCISISLSNSKALGVAANGSLYNICYTPTPNINNTWFWLNDTKTINFKTVTFDGYNMKAMATDNNDNIYYTTIPNNINSVTPIIWTLKNGKTNSISLSGSRALSIGFAPVGSIYYSSNPELSPIDWVGLNVNNNNFKEVSLDNYTPLTATSVTTLPATATTVTTLPSTQSTQSTQPLTDLSLNYNINDLINKGTLFNNNYINSINDASSIQGNKDNITLLALLEKSKKNSLNSKKILELQNQLKNGIQTSNSFPVDKLINTIKSKYNSQYLSTFANDSSTYGVLVNDKCMTINGLCKEDFCLLDCQNNLYSSDSQKFTTKRVYSAVDAAEAMNVPISKISSKNVYPYNIFSSVINNKCLSIGDEGLTVEKCNLNNIKQQWHISPDENICVLE